jgi:integrase
LNHLTPRGKKGIYQYRRRVPKEFVASFGKTEEVRSTGTTDFREAVFFAKRFDLEFEQELDRLRSTPETSERHKFAATQRHAANQLIKKEAHSSQEPKLSDFVSVSFNVLPSKLEQSEFLKAWQRWNFTKLQAAHEAMGEIEKEDELSRYNGFEPDFSKAIAKISDLIGEKKLPPEVTWAEACSFYEQDIDRRRKTTEKQSASRKRSYRLNAKILAKYFAQTLGGDGWDTPLSQINAELTYEFSRYYSKTYPQNEKSTFNKVVGFASTVFNRANKHFELKRSNPFSGLQEKQKSGTRRAFTPKELARLKDAVRLKQHSDPETYFITMLMLETGCRPSEASGVQIADLRLKEDVPHLWFNSNSTRALEKGSHDRPFPILEPLRTELSDWVKKLTNRGSEAPLFPETNTKKRAADSLSKKQNSFLSMAGIKKPKTLAGHGKVSIYSCRNTFITRGERSGVRTGLRYYLVGHTNPETTAIQRGYTDGASINDLLEALKKINQVTDWTYEGADKFSY